MGYTGKTLSVFSDTLTLKTIELKDKRRRVVFVQGTESSGQRLFRALCPRCKAWHNPASAHTLGPRKHTFACTSCGHEHGASNVCKGAEVK